MPNGRKGIIMKFFGKSSIKTLGEGLNRVKERFSAVGENLATQPGERLYKTPSGNIVTMQAYSDNLIIKKILAPFNKVKDYFGKFAGITRSYGAYVKRGDGNVRQYASTRIEKFAEKGDVQALGLLPRTEARNMGIFHASNISTIPKPELATNVTNTYTVTRRRTIPYAQAVAQGLKV